MNLVVEACARILRHDGWFVREPGYVPPPPAPPLTLEQMAGVLQLKGWTMLPPGVRPTLPLEEMIDLVRAEDFAVIQRTEPPPVLGTWTPGPHEDAGARVPKPRIVKGILGRDVSYECEGVMHTCRIGTFHAWRRKEAATHQGGEAAQ